MMCRIYQSFFVESDLGSCDLGDCFNRSLILQPLKTWIPQDSSEVLKQLFPQGFNQVISTACI